MTLWFASGNIHKKKELADILSVDILSVEILGGVGNLELKIPSDAGLSFEPEETGNSFLENALIKAEALYRLLEKQSPSDSFHPVIADDSGICVDALGGRPGIHSARYGAQASGENITDAEKNAKLLAELGDNPRRSARFVCAMVLYCGPDRFYAAQETLEGQLVENAEAARGRGGFGYDPILFIPELGRTVAELSEEEKNKHSHRGKAGRIIAKILSSKTINEESITQSH
jgi:XTP/dITP diphosphohydrolase